ncbi:MAG: hypothetical protein JXA77_18160 [Bacteroidales bacterium]|nr:hypothetical protein [Bacteroidales bacterium]MBN2818109.1 hypothetical protein [Bacteroidales bacterium]
MKKIIKLLVFVCEKIKKNFFKKADDNRISAFAAELNSGEANTQISEAEYNDEFHKYYDGVTRWQTV